jgi:hypothetical protein
MCSPNDSRLETQEEPTFEFENGGGGGGGGGPKTPGGAGGGQTGRDAGFGGPPGARGLHSLSFRVDRGRVAACKPSQVGNPCQEARLRALNPGLWLEASLEWRRPGPSLVPGLRGLLATFPPDPLLEKGPAVGQVLSSPVFSLLL